MDNPSQITLWIPVIGTLCGAVFGLLASFIIAFFNRSTQNNKEKNERDRKRLERIYELLIIIKSEKAMHMAHLLNWVHSGTPVKKDNEVDLANMPPIIELEMLTTLYFPALEKDRASFIDKIQEFGAISHDIESRRYTGESKESKQSVSLKLWKKIELINNDFKSFQIEISKTIKA